MIFFFPRWDMGIPWRLNSWFLHIFFILFLHLLQSKVQHLRHKKENKIYKKKIYPI